MPRSFSRLSYARALRVTPVHSVAAHLRDAYGLDPIEVLLLTTSLDGVLRAIADDDRETIPPPSATEEGEEQ